jgi:hypothetical protein
MAVSTGLSVLPNDVNEYSTLGRIWAYTFAMDDPVRFHLAKLLRFVRDARQSAVELVEAFDASEQLLKDERLPATANYGQAGLYQARDALLSVPNGPWPRSRILRQMTRLSFTKR